MPESNSNTVGIKERPRFAGYAVTLGGRDYTIPPLNVRALKELAPQLAKTAELTGMPSLEEWDDVLDVFLAAFQRNYPDMQRAELEDLVDMGNFTTLSKAVFGGSGLSQGEDKPGMVSP